MRPQDRTAVLAVLKKKYNNPLGTSEGLQKKNASYLSYTMSTAVVPVWGQTAQNLTGVSPERFGDKLHRVSLVCPQNGTAACPKTVILFQAF